jgi:hypothetical protein
MTLQRLVNLAFFDIGAIASGETPSTDESTDALDLANHILSSWSAEELTCYNRKHYTVLAIAGLGTYSIGPAGTWVTTARPVKVEGATAYYLNWRQGLEVVSMAEFALRSSAPKGQTQPLPELLGVDNASPALNARVFPASSLGCSIDLHTLEPLTAFAALGDTVALPPAYERALRLALAVELSPQYARSGGIDPVLAANAQNAKATIAQINAGMTLPQAPPPAAQ